jgi:hypothetical protein
VTRIVGARRAPSEKAPVVAGAFEARMRRATTQAKRAQAEVCPICDFQTTPPHDGRTHRSQKKQAPFSAAELTEKGLAKV